ncbi:MAG TPA: COX15/CtaA family protein [Trueperaceae bacterium]
MRKLSTAALAWTTLIATWLLIIQGAVVRATGSGAGCGSHWPTCNGQVIPLAHSTESLIEFSHRLLSLAILAFGSWLWIRAFRERRDNPGLFVFASAAFVFLIFEALLGAATVLLGLTGDNVSVGRGLMVATHLVNSLLLVGTSSIAAVYAGAGRRLWPLRLSRQGLLTGVLGFGLAGMLVLMFSGGIAAMGDTMFPTDSLQAGLVQDFSPNAHLMVRLRVLHPLIALVVGVYLFVSLGLAWWLKPVPAARRLARALFGVYVAQLLLGALNWWFLAPIVLQLLHLSTATLAFGLLAALSVTALGSEAVPVGRSAEPVVSLRAPSAKKEV